MTIYLPDNPATLLQESLDALSSFSRAGLDLCIHQFCDLDSNGFTVNKSLACAVIERVNPDTLPITYCSDSNDFDSATETIAVAGLNADHECYISHVKFINSFVNIDMDIIIDYLSSCCVFRMDFIPDTIPNKWNGSGIKWLEKDKRMKYIKQYLEYLMDTSDLLTLEDEETTSIDSIKARLDTMLQLFSRGKLIQYVAI